MVIPVPLRTVVPRVTVPSLNVTEPVGAELPDVATLAVNAISTPKVAGFGLAVSVITVGSTARTFIDRATESGLFPASDATVRIPAETPVIVGAAASIPRVHVASMAKGCDTWQVVVTGSNAEFSTVCIAEKFSTAFPSFSMNANWGADTVPSRIGP